MTPSSSAIFWYIPQIHSFPKDDANGTLPFSAIDNHVIANQIVICLTWLIATQ